MSLSHPNIVINTSSLPAGAHGLPWRIPYTLRSSSQNFEDLGVTVGDSLIATITDDSSLAVDVLLQVVGVDGYSLGFVLSPEPLFNDVIPEVPAYTIKSVADRFGISSVSELPNQELAVSGEAAEIISYLQSVYFQREYWGRELTPTTPIVVKGRTFYLIPKSIVRNRRVPIDQSVVSVPALQEYIRQPVIKEEAGRTYIVRGEKLTEVARAPVVLHENQHYVVDEALAFKGPLAFLSGSDLIDADAGDFVDRGIAAGDTLRILLPYELAGEYRILTVLSRNKLKLATKVPKYPLADYVTAEVEIRRRGTGRFVRFIPGAFTPKYPAPSRLWAETTFFDNNENIERNFGILVGLTRNDIDKLADSATYRQAVAGLMYAYTSGGAIDQVRLGASLLLGLPFAEHRGIVRSVDLNYRLNVEGVPVQGRILIEDLKDDNSPSGLVRIYTFPLDTVQFSTLSGVETNPATGEPYAVGDTVEAYAQLAKGVEVSDYLSAPSFGSAQVLQQFHSARVRINDNIFSNKEMQLVAAFLRRITPSYVSMHIASSTEVADSPDVNDVLVNKVRSNSFVEFVGANSSAISAFDHRNWNGYPTMVWDSPPFDFRRTSRNWIIADEGADYITLSLPEGGLINARTSELIDSPLCVSTDWLMVMTDGGETSVFKSIEILSDTQLKILGSPVLDVGNTIHAAVVRPMSAKLPGLFLTDSSLDDSITDNGKTYYYSDVTMLSGGLRSSGVAPGDWMLQGTLSSAGDPTFVTRHTVLEVSGSTYFDVVRVTPPIAVLGPEAEFWRPQLLNSPVMTAEISVEGGVTIAAGSDYDFEIIRALADPGDELLFEGDPAPFVFLDPVAGLVDRTLPTGLLNVSLYKKTAPANSTLSGLAVWNRLLPGISDLSEIKISQGTNNPEPNGAISGTNVTWAGWNPATAGVRPGDFFRPLTAIDSNTTEDVGYGAGTYPITQVSATTITLATALSNGSTEWEIFRRA